MRHTICVVVHSTTRIQINFSIIDRKRTLQGIEQPRIERFVQIHAIRKVGTIPLLDVRITHGPIILKENMPGLSIRIIDCRLQCPNCQLHVNV